MIIRFISHFFYALEGLWAALKSERHLRFHFVAAFFMIGLGFYFQLHRFEWMILLMVIFLVIICELMNTALEKVIDYISTDQHPLAKFCKDVAASAVLCSALLAVLVGFILFFDRIQKAFY